MKTKTDNLQAPQAIDPMAMARFLVLPGASRLLEAFAAIPPGPLRESVIHHAEVIAQTYQAAPADVRMPDPLHHLSGPVIDRPQIASRTGRQPRMEGKDAEIVRLRMEEGLQPKAIATRLDLNPSTVFAALDRARKAGIPVPKRDLPPPKNKGRGKGSQDKKTWTTTLDQLSGQGRAAMERAAAIRGIDAQAYLDRRQLALKMAMEGSGYDAILVATGETDSKVVSAWLSVARGAGFQVPFLTAAEAVTEKPAPARAEDNGGMAYGEDARQRSVG